MLTAALSLRLLAPDPGAAPPLAAPGTPDGTGPGFAAGDDAADDGCGCRAGRPVPGDM